MRRDSRVVCRGPVQTVRDIATAARAIIDLVARCRGPDALYHSAHMALGGASAHRQFDML